MLKQRNALFVSFHVSTHVSTKVPTILSVFVSVIALILCSTTLSAAVTPGHRAVVKGTDSAPYGFVEFIPTTYSGSSTHPLVLFLHGAGERNPGTDSTAVWDNGTRHGPSKLIKNGTTWFQDQNAIVLSPIAQYSWDIATIDSFVTWALAHYRINPARVYVTGVSLGGGGTWAYVSAHGDRVAACIPICGSTGAGDPTKFAGVPTWSFHAWGDTTVSRTNSIGWSNRIAAFLLGQGPNAATNVLAGYPHLNGNTSNAASQTMTALFNTSWVWTAGVNATTTPKLKMTLYTDGSHDSWTRTYADKAVWDWLFSYTRGAGTPANQTPVATITAPGNNSILTSGSVTLSGSGNDPEDGALSGSALQWTSSISGNLGSGISRAVTLVPGLHTITLTATDSAGAHRAATVVVRVRRSTAYTITVDLGADEKQTTGNINNLTPTIANIADATGTDGSTTGVAIAITNRFVSANGNGVISSALYPTTSQSDTLYVDSAGDAEARITISNLDPALFYDLRCFASRIATDLRGSVYTVGSSTATLNAAGNTSNRVTLADLRPSAAGEIILVITPQSGSQYGYLGALDIIAHTTAGGGTGTSTPVITGLTVTIQGTCSVDVTSVTLNGVTAIANAGTFTITAPIPASGLDGDLVGHSPNGTSTILVVAQPIPTAPN